MPALITEAIPSQGFEIVRDAIGSVLLLELTNQKSIQSLPEAIEIFRERIAPMDSAENLYFNVVFDSDGFSEKTQRDAQGKATYFIDIYTTGKNTNLEDGSLNSGIRLHKYLGLVRYILQDTRYKTLGLPVGTIGGTMVEMIATAEPTPFQDAGYIRFGRVTYSVRILENQGAWNGIDLFGDDTTVTIEQTSKGYKYAFTVS